MFRRHVHVVFWKIGPASYHSRQLSYSFETRPKSLPGSSRFSIWRQSLLPKSLNKTFHEKCRMFGLPSGHCTPLIKMRNKPEFGVFSLQPSPRWGVGWAAMVYKKLCSIKLVVGKNLLNNIGFSLRKIKRTNYSYKLPPFLIKKPRKKPVSIKLGRCYPQNPSDMGIPFSYYLSELG